MREVTEFIGQNWVITPAARAVNEPEPASIHDQKWLLVLSGVGEVNLAGELLYTWSGDTVHILPDMRSPLDWAIQRFSIPRPAGTEGATYEVKFRLEEWAPFATVSSAFVVQQVDPPEGHWATAGFAVNAWRPSHFGTGNDVLSGHSVENLFQGILVDAAVGDSNDWIFRLAYHITLMGYITFVGIQIT